MTEIQEKLQIIYEINLYSLGNNGRGYRSLEYFE